MSNRIKIVDLSEWTMLNDFPEDLIGKTGTVINHATFFIQVAVDELAGTHYEKYKDEGIFFKSSEIEYI